MKDFSFKIPQEIVFGLGSLKKLPGILKDNHIDNALLVNFLKTIHSYSLQIKIHDFHKDFLKAKTKAVKLR